MRTCKKCKLTIQAKRCDICESSLTEGYEILFHRLRATERMMRGSFALSRKILRAARRSRDWAAVDMLAGMLHIEPRTRERKYGNQRA